MGAIYLQPCIVCSLNRRVVRTEPVATRYEIQSLECPSCKSVVRLVQIRATPNRVRPINFSAPAVSRVGAPRAEAR